MPRLPRSALLAALALLVFGVAALATQPTPAPRVLAATAAPVTTTTTAATPAPPPTTTTSTPTPPPPRLSSQPTPPSAPITTKVASRPPVATAPAPPPVAVPHGGRVACGWTWDAIRIDDGSSNVVTLTLSAPSRPNSPVTITAKPGGPTTPAMARAVTTDGAGQAVGKFSLSEDKRDWTLTISATFPGGSYCPSESFTLDYLY